MGGPAELMTTRCNKKTQDGRVQCQGGDAHEGPCFFGGVTLSDFDHADESRNEQNRATEPVPIRLECPTCGELHIDEGEFATKPHHTHACQHCGAVWRPAVVATGGVRFLPGFKNAAPEPRR